MKIIFDCERMKYPFTGLFEYSHQLGISLGRLLDKDELVYYAPHEVQKLFDQRSKFINQRDSDKFFRSNYNVDIIHTTYQLSNYLRGNKKAKRILTIHDLNFLYEGKSVSKVKKYLRQLQKNIDHSDHLITISNYVKSDIEAYLDTKGKPVDVIYNGCNIVHFENYMTPVYMPRSKFIFSIGTVIPKKNFHVLPRVLVGNDYELIIAGQPGDDYPAKIMQEAKLFGVNNRLKLIGPISSEDKYWYLKNCTAFMFPSIAEGFGIPVIEAMHFGKPTFLSTLTSLPEVGGKHAYYFENFDAETMQKKFRDGMQDYIENSKADSIKEHASFFKWDRCAAEYYEKYKMLLK